jgi:hypothetical protein
MTNVLRTRIIKPGIVTNEKLAALGPHAALLFERLWMLADREGRIEYRPERIRVEVFPYWPEIDVENLVEGLCKSGFLQKYRPATSPNYSRSWFLFVKHFLKHQKIHPHEHKSVLPPPPEINGLDGADVITSSDMSLHVSPMVSDVALPLPLPLPLPLLLKEEVLRREERRSGGEEENPPPPPSDPTPSAKKTRAPKRREPGRETQVANPAGEAAPTTRQQAVDFWPHDPEAVEWVRDLLAQVGREAGLPPPDDAILRRILDAGRDAGAEDIYHFLRKNWQRGRFRSMHSWGLLPLVVGSAMKAA